MEDQLKALAKTVPADADPALLDQLPLAGDVLPRLSPQLKTRLFQAFDVSVLWNKTDRQATVRAEITETAPVLAAILDPGQDGFDDTHPRTDRREPMGYPGSLPERVCRMPQPQLSKWERWARGGGWGLVRRCR